MKPYVELCLGTFLNSPEIHRNHIFNVAIESFSHVKMSPLAAAHSD
ncbi:hypothetical protein HNR05_000308 [Leifsonia psychrotolerans]|uniref:Uncharacterized protein n=1 Tax=Glaciibacter psychrotolerans TaxID=670054 RepID=A0A7Z0J4L5_9MICO|nr:hypothetical protein [Leifsonia psychrotolerans]